jgi:hypothetical protein
MTEVRSHLGKLIKQATPKGSKFVIFIDDLDRCRPPRSVDVLEAVNQLLDHPGVVVVIMSDMQVVAKCAEIKYKDLLTPETPIPTNQACASFATYGWSFLQKIIQLQFDLPIYPARMIRRMIEDLAREVPAEKAAGWVRTIWQRLNAKVHRVFSRLPWVRIFWIATACISDLALVLVLFKVPWIMNRAFPIKIGNLTKFSMLAIAAVIGTLLAEMLPRIVARTRESRRRRQIDERIRVRIAAGERDFAKVEAYVRMENSAWRNDPEAEGLVRERLQRYLEDESEIQREAEDEVMRHLEPMPRHAKRLLNRLRLLLFIAHERKMFGGKPVLSSRHIAKWAVLGERWPELLQLVCLNSDVMQRLENSETHDVIINERAPIYKNDRALRRFCLSRAGVKLSPIVRRIVEFAPASTGQKKPLSR